MTDEWQFTPGGRAQIDKEGLPELAKRQHGVVSRAQLLSGGISGSTISRWLAAGRLHRVHRSVYAVGHDGLALPGRLIAALLLAGAGSALSHTTAAWAWRLVETDPRRIHVTAPRRLLSLPEVRIHHCPELETVHCRGFPVTPVARTLVDVAEGLTARQLRRALAEADYRGLLDPNDASAALRRGRSGSRALREALANHLPQLAQTLSVLEERFLELCHSAGLPLPEMNGRVGRMRVDALWREQEVVVELDGAAAHGGWAQIKRDRQREMALRAMGFQMARYTWDQVTGRPGDVIDDLRRLLSHLQATRPP